MTKPVNVFNEKGSAEEMLIADLIIESMPFSDELIAWTTKKPEFAEALKVIYPNNFLTLQAISITYPTSKTNDQVLGVFAYDRKLKKFKQDFIVNIANKHEEFILYTALPGKNPKYTKYVQHINGFFSKYGTNGHYANTHHPTYEQLPPEIQERADLVLDLANRLDKSGLRQLSQDELHTIYLKIKGAKKDGTRRYRHK